MKVPINNNVHKFIFTGFIAISIHSVSYLSLIYFYNIHPQLSNTFAYFAALLFAYYAHLKWTFADRDGSINIESFSKFIIASLLIFSLNSACVYFVNDYLEINSMFAIIGIVLLSPMSYFLSRAWVFSKKKVASFN